MRGGCGVGVERGLRLLVVAVALVAADALPSRATAQDIETVARLRGLELPAAYYRRVAEDPTAYTLPNGLFRTEGLARVATRTNGTARIPVLLALFSDSPEPHITRDVIQASLFDGPAERGTITESYLEMSRGSLTVTGDVLPWVRTSRPHATVVGTGNGLGQDADLGPYFLEALALVDSAVDFGVYDSDGPDGVPNSGDDDGLVDAMTFEYLEIAGSCGGPSIWPHRWGISGWTEGEPYVTNDLRPDGTPVKVDGYITQSVADCSGQVVQSANVIAHEFGHVLGLPDYYHPTASGGALGRRWVLGCWELMAAGSWGCGSPDADRIPFGPTHMSAHSKHQLGWIQYDEVGEVWNHEVFLEPVQTSGRALRVPLGSSGREFLLIEYRAQVGFDHQLPAGGVLMYKQDLDASRRPNPISGDPYFLSMLEQDGNNGLRRNFFEGGNRGEAGDAWGLTGRTRKLHAITSPQLRLSSGAATSVTVHEVDVEDGRARLVLSTSPTPRVIAPAAPIEVSQVTEFLKFVRVAGGVMPYTPSGEMPEGVSVSADGDEIFVKGSVAGPGPFALVLRVRDARGAVSPEAVVALSAGPWTVSIGSLLQLFLQSPERPLTLAERAYLDGVGNQNGRYDVGDLRRWIREQGAGGS